MVAKNEFIELNELKFKKVIPKNLTIAQLELIQEDLTGIIKEFFKSMKNTGSENENVKVDIGELLTGFNSAKLFSLVIPIIYINEDEEKFNKSTYFERKEIMNDIEITDEIMESVGEFLTISFTKLGSYFQKFMKTMTQTAI